MNGYVSEIFSSFQGEGLFAGRRHVFLRLAGCNLRCSYCDTPDSLERTPTCTIHDCDGGERSLANPLRPDRLSSLLAPFLSAPGVHALAVTGGEPLLQAGFLADVLSATCFVPGRQEPTSWISRSRSSGAWPAVTRRANFAASR